MRVKGREQAMPYRYADQLNDNYVDMIAKWLLEEIGETSSPPELLRIYAHTVLLVGEAVTWQHIHDGWAVWRATTNPEHPELVPGWKLANQPVEIAKDQRWIGAIQVATRKWNAWLEAQAASA